MRRGIATHMQRSSPAHSANNNASYHFPEVYVDFRTTRYTLTSPKISKAMTILMLGDLHNAQHGPDNCDLLAACRRERPDLVLCVGDMSVGVPGAPFDGAVCVLRGLAELAPCLGVNGNHAAKMRAFGDGSYERYEHDISAAGVRVLNNDTCSLAVCGNPVSVTGIELPDEKYKKMRIPHMTEQEVRALIGRRPDDGQYHILLAHNPQFMDRYFEWGADLVLSGHFHGGILHFRNGRSLISPYGLPFPKYGYGLFSRGGQSGIVTSGLGEHTLPFRFTGNNPMEIVVISVQKAV
jgi:predicted MPP superfamily phosphohydrolase